MRPFFAVFPQNSAPSIISSITFWNLALSPRLVCHCVQFIWVTWTGDLHREHSDSSARALFLPVSWDFKLCTAYLHTERLTPHRLSLSEAKLTYFASQIQFLLLAHHAAGSLSLLIQLHTQERMPFPLLQTFLSYLYSTLKHLISALPISLLGTLYVLTNGNLMSFLIILPIFVVPLIFIILLENPLSYTSQTNCMGFPFQGLLLMVKLNVFYPSLFMISFLLSPDFLCRNVLSGSNSSPVG